MSSSWGLTWMTAAQWRDPDLGLLRWPFCPPVPKKRSNWTEMGAALALHICPGWGYAVSDMVTARCATRTSSLLPSSV